MVSAERFLAILEEKDLLSPEAIAQLRQQIGRLKTPPDATSIAKQLIAKKQLTPAIVERIFAGAATTPGSAPSTGGSQDDELGLAPLDDKPQSGPGHRSPAPKPPAEQPPKPKSQPEKTKGTAGKGPAGRAAARSDSLLDQELTPLGAPGGGAAGMDSLLQGGAIDESTGLPLAPTRRRRSLRRWFRDLFRRGRSDVVYVKQTDPRKAKLIIGSWATAIGLLVVGLGIFWYFSPPSSDKLYTSAELEYETGQYGPAVTHFDEFINRFPLSPRISSAKVHRGVATIRLAIADARQTGDWSAAYKRAQEIVKEIGSEEDLRAVQSDLGVALTAIAEGLAARARESRDASYARQAEIALRLVELNVPAGSRPKDRMNEVEAALATVGHDLGQDQEAEEAAGAIREAMKQGDVKRAYEIRNALVARYPDLETNPVLEKALVAAGRALQASVKLTPQTTKAETVERPTGVIATLAFAQPLVKGVTPARAQMIYAQTGGAVYGLDAATGRAVWRRFSGDNERPCRFPPLALGRDPGSDIILVDPSHRELTRVEGASGRLQWRFHLGEVPIAQPTRVGNRLVVPCPKGRLAILDLLTGDLVGDLTIPQGLGTGPVVDAESAMIFQIAESSNIYVIATADWSCREVFHLGHAVGSVRATPVLGGSYLLVVVNDAGQGPATSTLHVLAASPAGKEGPTLRRVQQVRLKGHVTSAPLVYGQRVLIVSMGGGLQVLTIGSDPRAPVQITARSELTDVEQQQRFVIAVGKYFWIADRQLAKYEVETDRRRISLRKITEQGFTFLQPLVALGTKLFSVRQKEGIPGVLVSAVDMEKQEIGWQTLVGASLAGEPMADATGARLTAVTATGAMFPIELANIGKSAMLDQPEIEIEPGKLSQPLRYLLPMSGGMFAMAPGAGSKEIALYDPQEREKRFHWLLAGDEMATGPIVFRGGLLAACKSGRVYLLDPMRPGNLAEPFDPGTRVAAAYAWRRPDAADDTSALLADGEVTLYRLGVEGTKPKQLVAARETKVEHRLVSPLAALGQSVYAVDAEGKLSAFSLPDLAPGKRHALEGQCVWGPQRVGKYVLAATDKGQLYCLNGGQEIVWNKPLPYGPLAGPPVAVDDEFLLAGVGGMVWRLRASNGEELGKVDAAVPLATGPVLIGKRLIVGSPDGCLYEIKRPDK